MAQNSSSRGAGYATLKGPQSKSAIEHIREIASELAKGASGGTRASAGKLRKEIRGVISELALLSASLDPVGEPKNMFNPADPQTVGSFVGVALVAQNRMRLPSVPRFYGSGVYAIYYDGPFEAYQPICGTENPIYVGKADPRNPRARTPREQGERLSARLREHRRTIGFAEETIDLADFSCRYLVVQSGWQTAAEDFLIDLFRPVWNNEVKICYGFGKHGDAPSTRKNLKSPWDTLHAGRKWATTPDAKPRMAIISEMREHFKAHRPVRDIASVLRHFFDALRQVASNAS